MDLWQLHRWTDSRWKCNFLWYSGSDRLRSLGKGQSYTFSQVKVKLPVEEIWKTFFQPPWHAQHDISLHNHIGGNRPRKVHCIPWRKIIPSFSHLFQALFLPLPVVLQQTLWFSLYDKAFLLHSTPGGSCHGCFPQLILMLQDGNEFGDGNQHWGYCQVWFNLFSSNTKNNQGLHIPHWQQKCQGEESKTESPYNLGRQDEVSHEKDRRKRFSLNIDHTWNNNKFYQVWQNKIFDLRTWTSGLCYTYNPPNKSDTALTSRWGGDNGEN